MTFWPADGLKKLSAAAAEAAPVISYAHTALSSLVRASERVLSGPPETDDEVLQGLSKLEVTQAKIQLEQSTPTQDIEIPQPGEAELGKLPEASSLPESQVSTKEDCKEASLPIYSLEDVRMHDTLDDAWMVIYDRVYDVTDFLDEHPGGCEVMHDYLGLDASLAFRGVGHSPDAMEMLDQFQIGVLTESQRMYKTTDSMAW